MVAFCGVMFVMLAVSSCGNGGEPASSLGWSRVPHEDDTLGGDTSQVMLSVTAGGPGLVAVGLDGPFTERDAAVWTSPDGVDWSRVPHDETVLGGTGNQVMLSVVTGGPGLVAVGSDALDGDLDAAVWTSPDGVNWSRVPHDETVLGGAGNQAMQGVTTGGPGLVAVGRDGPTTDSDAAVWTSPDGSIWFRVPHEEPVFGGETSQAMFGVTAGGPGLVAVGDGGPVNQRDAAVWTSPDGVIWSRVPHDETVLGGEGTQGMFAVTRGPQGLVAVGIGGSIADRDAAVWTSPDGKTWSRIPHNEGVFGGRETQEMLSVTAWDLDLVAVGVTGRGGRFDAAVWIWEAAIE